MKAISKARFFYQLAVFISCLLYLVPAQAQETTLVQVKTYDIDLKAIPGLQFSFDEVFYFTTEANGSAIVELNPDLLPPKAIYFKDAKLEAESWNYSKGILEIIVRKKLYEIYNLTFIDDNGILLNNTAITIDYDVPIAAVTNSAGITQLAIPLDLDLKNPENFQIEGYSIVEADISGNTGRIIAAIIPPPVQTPVSDPVALVITPTTAFDIGHLDSLKTLPLFWSFVRSLDMVELAPGQQLLIDNKFNELLLVFKDSLPVIRATSASGIVSDTSAVSNDIRSLTEQALLELQTININRGEFNKAFDRINDKLVAGGSNLSEEDRQNLLEEINRLDRLLVANEALFTENQQTYKSSIGELKNQLLNIEQLERQLSEVEKQRIEERKQFQQSLMIALGISIGLLLLVILFVYLTRKITKQKRALVVAHDEVKEINNNLEYLVAKRTKTLQRVNKELDTFLYRSSHDLKRPLSSIMGLANIAKITLNEEANALFEKTRQTADEMDRLLQKLITISQINYPEADSDVNFSEIIDSIKDEFKEAIDKSGANVKYNVANDLSFHSNTKLMECILRNLIDNALFYSSLSSRNSPEVEVTIIRKEQSIHISVNDNGDGISEEIEGKVWNMFYRGNESSAGNGLGLYITKRAVNALKGTISFETTRGEFTKFNVEIPLSKPKSGKGKKAPDKEELELA